MAKDNETGESAGVINADRAYQTAWLVYINGIEVPAMSASVSYGVWQIPEAEITLVPDPILQRIGAEDRLPVQIFYCDYWQNPNKPAFRLMFDGEVVAWSYVNVSKGRAISLNCVDYIQIFTQLFFFFMSSVNDIAIGESGDNLGVDINGVKTAGFRAAYPYSLFAEGLISPEGEDSEGTLIKRPIDFVYNVIRGMIQADVPNRSIAASNFFAPWTKRTNFHKRFVSLPFLEAPGKDEDGDDPAGVFPILRAVRADFAVSAVAKMATNVGASGSIWSMLQQIMQTLMMEIVMLPTPAAFASDYDKLNSAGPPDDRIVSTAPTFLGNYFVKPQFLFGIPPACNVFFPSQVRHFSYNENYVTQPTRMYFNDEGLMSYLNTDNNTSEGLAQVMRDALAVAHPEEANLAVRASMLNAGGDNGKNILIYPEEFYKGPVVDRRPMPRWFMFLQDAQKGDSDDDDDDDDDDDSAEADGKTREIYRKYAQYEYFKERYSRRTGGLQLAFNPYPVPGFPCAVFDRRSTQVDVVGYISSVRQLMHHKGWSTQVSFSHGRTLREMFSLMQRQFVLENEGADVNRDEIEEKVKEDKVEDLANIPQPTGAIATAPAEPIVEVRDIVQNFQRAEAFYRALFFRVPAPDADELSERQLRAEADRRTGGKQTPSDTTSRIEVPPAPPLLYNQDKLENDIKNRRASFWYHEIIDFVEEDGTRQGIQIEGIDASSRHDALKLLDKEEISDEELDFLRDVSGNSSLERDDEEAFKKISVQLRTTKVSNNVSGDKDIKPKERAEKLFESYEAAMRYCARPICTLEEYILFLADDGVKEGLVEPLEAMAQGDTRVFPAPYYKRIRKYTPGPPEELPSTDITNTDSLTSVDGAKETFKNASGSEPTVSEIQGLPDDFPENRADWNSILLTYRRNVLRKLPPRT